MGASAALAAPCSAEVRLCRTSDYQLRSGSPGPDPRTARLGAEPGIPAASTFNSAAEAEAAVAATLRQTAAQFWEWLAAGGTGKLELTGSFSGGSVMLRGATASTPGSGITLVLKGSGGGNWFILTGFPIP